MLFPFWFLLNLLPIIPWNQTIKCILYMRILGQKLKKVSFVTLKRLWLLNYISFVKLQKEWRFDRRFCGQRWAVFTKLKIFTRLYRIKKELKIFKLRFLYHYSPHIFTNRTVQNFSDLKQNMKMLKDDERIYIPKAVILNTVITFFICLFKQSVWRDGNEMM